MERWYFAYGSNLLVSQMVARTGLCMETAKPTRVKLPGYRLAFNMLAEDGHVYANIIPVDKSESADGGVLGVVYWCSEDVLMKLDVFESGYDRREITVYDESSKPIAAITYFSRPETQSTEARPTDVYLARIVIGAREQGLSAEYVRTIEQLASSF